MAIENTELLVTSNEVLTGGALPFSFHFSRLGEVIFLAAKAPDKCFPGRNFNLPDSPLTEQPPGPSQTRCTDKNPFQSSGHLF